MDSEQKFLGLKDQFEKLKREHEELQAKIQNDHQGQLTEISKKLSATLKEHGQDEMLAELTLARAKILDHFTLAYMAYMTEENLTPDQIKLVQGVNEDGYVEMFFERHSTLNLVQN